MKLGIISREFRIFSFRIIFNYGYFLLSMENWAEAPNDQQKYREKD